MGRWMIWSALLVGVWGSGVAGADVTGSYDGQIGGPKVASPMQAATAFSQAGTFLTGTVALDGDPASFGGAYVVSGKATAKKVKISGANPNGVILKWSAKIVGSTVQGKVKLKAPGSKVVGTLALTRNVSTGDGSGCDAVYSANTTLFVDQVMGQALTACTSCHVAGGQAGAARLRITASDPLATARSVALVVDASNPSASRLLAKPTGLLPHGGGQQIQPGSTEAQILSQWIALVAAAHCN